jgi:hypothetical protein
MSKKRVLKTERGVTLSQSILFGGEPRKQVGVVYKVTTKRNPKGRDFTTIDEAKKYFAVQLSLGKKE